MIQINGELERMIHVVPEQVGETLRPVADSTRFADDEDDLIDGWLASLSLDHFERFLSGLADSYVIGSSALDPPA